MAKIEIKTPKTETTIGYISFETDPLKGERLTPKTETNIQYYVMDSMGDAILKQEQTLMNGTHINGDTILALFESADETLIDHEERIETLEAQMTALEARVSALEAAG